MGYNQSPNSNRSRSGSAESNRSTQSNGSGSNHSRSPSRSRSRSRSRSGSGSPVSNRSRSGSPGSKKSNRSRSRSAQSNRSAQSDRSRSGSRSPSQRSRSGSHSSRSRSAASNRSNASGGSKRSRSRSRSGSGSHSHRSRSGSVESGKSNRSRSKSVQSNRSKKSSRSGRSGSNASQRSRSRSQSRSPNARSRSGSRTPKEDAAKSNIQNDSGNEDKGADAADLFGDADDISSDEDKAKGANTLSEDRRSDEEDDPRKTPTEQDDDRDRMIGIENEGQEDEDKEAEVEPIPETRIDVKIPKISCDLGKEIHFVKLPNFLSVETRPFDQATYEDEIDEEETLDEEGRARLKLKVENTIRWREEINKDGDFVKHSNARLVRWSDGSLSLQLGSEIFDVYKQPLQGDHNHLFIRQGTGLQGQAVFRTKLSFRPHSTESFTHRKMTMSLADRSQKTSGIKILSQVGLDPDQDRKTLLKKEEEKLKQTFRHTKPRKSSTGSRLHTSQAYREEEGSEDECAISLNAIKNKYKSGSNVHSKGGAIYSSDEEGSDFEGRRMKKMDKAKALDSNSSDDSD